MRAKVVNKPILTPEQREDLEGRLMAVERLRMCEREIDEKTPELIALLDAWEDCRVPLSAGIVLKAYHTRTGWLVGSVADVLDVIRRVVEA